MFSCVASVLDLLVYQAYQMVAVNFTGEGEVTTVNRP